MDLVKEFYQNIKFESNQVSSRVKEIIIDFNEDILGRALRIPIGVLEDDANAKLSRLGCTLRRGVGQFEKVQAKNLNAKMRFLHIIICWILLPRASQFDFIIKRDITLIYHFVREISLNVPHIIIQVMREAISRMQASLPYAMALTHVYRFFGVHL